MRSFLVLTVLWASSFEVCTRKLDTVEKLVKAAKEELDGGDKKLGRGYLTLALHMDPFLVQDEAFRWVAPFLSGEPLVTWRGNLFVGLDKTYLESINRQGLFEDPRKMGHLLLTWRNLELTGLSCCGIDNMAVLFQSHGRHMYVAPFVDLVPGYDKNLKEQNKKMYDSFKEWWASTGKRPMPEPPVIHRGMGQFEWPLMKVLMRKSRMPAGWNELIQAVILYRLAEHDYARSSIRAALAKNADLGIRVPELMPNLKVASVTATLQPFLAETKYIVCYNPHVGLGNLAVVMVSAHLLAKLTGRKFVLSWNVNRAVEDAFKVNTLPGVALLPDSVSEVGLVAPQDVRKLYFFHMMHSPDLGDMLELLACSDMTKELSPHRVVTVSSNLFFAPLLAVNPHVPKGTKADFAEELRELLSPSDAAAKRALDFLKGSDVAMTVPLVAVHIRAREEGQDNDDWPTANSPTKDMLQNLRSCVEKAVARELQPTKGWFGSSAPEWDVFIASTTEKAQAAVAKEVDGLTGLRRVLQLPSLLRDRNSVTGSVDAMAEALIISRAQVFVRLVVGTSGFSTFAYMSNALRRQNDWVRDVPALHRAGFAPNYLVTSSCGKGRCFVSRPEVRMARIDWHGDQFCVRSCGRVLDKVENTGPGTLGCKGLTAIDVPDEL